MEAGAIFTIKLKNTVAYGADTVRWLEGFGHLELSGDQKRLLAYAREHGGNFTSRNYQKLVGVDIYTASRDIKDLIFKGVVKLPKKGGRVYELLSSSPRDAIEKPPEYTTLEPVLEKKGYVKNEDIRKALGVSMRQAGRIANRLVTAGWLRPEGDKRGRCYFPGRLVIGHRQRWPG